jgi:thymidylate synthase
MIQYQNLIREVIDNGSFSNDRTGVGTYRIFGTQSKYDLPQGFPLQTTKKVFWKAVVGELLWFLSGSTNRDELEFFTHGTIGENSTIWDEWANGWGELGPIYGSQWRSWTDKLGPIDQISRLVDEIKTNPSSRRMLVSSWNVGDLDFMALQPCHAFFQVVIIDGKIHLQFYQRSADIFLGVPFNIASYALLTHMLAHVTGYEVGTLTHTIGDAHIYSNHLEQVNEVLSREPRELPRLSFKRKVNSIFDFRMDDIILDVYNPCPKITADVAI